MILSRSSSPAAALAGRAGLVLAGSALIAVSAQISVPMIPVPMTLQTLAVLATGFALGARLGVAAVAAYILEGVAGLPVFAGGHAGLAYALGPTAGFLLGFLLMAAATGLAADRGLRHPMALCAAAILASALLYLPGLAWPALALGVPTDRLLSGWLLPFIPGDLVKALVAGLTAAGAAALLARRTRG